MQKFGAISLQVKHDVSQGTHYWGEVPKITKLLMQSAAMIHFPNFLIIYYNKLD